LAIAGAVAFGLSSYMIIGLGAGHNARIGAIAFYAFGGWLVFILSFPKRLLRFHCDDTWSCSSSQGKPPADYVLSHAHRLGYGLVQMIWAYSGKADQKIFY